MARISEIIVTSTGGRRARRRMRDIRRRLVDDRPIMGNIGRFILRPAMKERFDSEGKVGGQKWGQLEESTVRDRIRKGLPGSHPIGVQEGDMRRSFLDLDAPGHIHEVSVHRLVEGTTDQKAIWFHHGTPKQVERLMTRLRSGTLKKIRRYYLSGIVTGGAGLIKEFIAADVMARMRSGP